MLVLLASLGTAQAAEVTEMPPELRGDVDITYAGTFTSGGLEEAGGIVAEQRISRHDLSFVGAFAPTEGVAVTIGLPVTPSWKVSYTTATAMLFDPVTGTGTFVGGEALSPLPELKGSGLTGLWLGAAVAPFSERYPLGQRVSYRIDLAFRTPSPGNSWWSAEGGQRGAGMGGSAWKIGAAFSTDHGASEPYLNFAAVREGKITLDIVDEAGTTWATALTVHPASTVDVTGGVEIVANEKTDIDQRLVFDLFVAFGYRGWQDIPSGLFLPDVIDVSRGISVTSSEYLLMRAGLGLLFDINKYVSVRLAGDGRIATPHTLEHVYAVRTSLDTFEIGFSSTVEGRFR
jgi:hypothetical protein